jgi:hypothetical protein
VLERIAASGSRQAFPFWDDDEPHHVHVHLHRINNLTPLLTRHNPNNSTMPVYLYILPSSHAFQPVSSPKTLTPTIISNLKNKLTSLFPPGLQLRLQRRHPLRLPSPHNRQLPSPPPPHQDPRPSIHPPSLLSPRAPLPRAGQRGVRCAGRGAESV